MNYMQVAWHLGLLSLTRALLQHGVSSKARHRLLLLLLYMYQETLLGPRPKHTMCLYFPLSCMGNVWCATWRSMIGAMEFSGVFQEVCFSVNTTSA